MEKQPIRDCGRLFKVAHGLFNLESNRAYFFWIDILSWGDGRGTGSNHTHILEGESKEFQEAMRAQVGTTFSQINNPNKVDSFKHLLVLVLWPSG